MKVKRSLGALLRGQSTVRQVVQYDKVPPPHIVQGVRDLTARQSQLRRYMSLGLLVLLSILVLMSQIPHLIYSHYQVVPSIEQVVFPAELSGLIEQNNVPSGHGLWFGGLFIIRLIAVIWLSGLISRGLKHLNWTRTRLQRMLIALLSFVALWHVSGVGLAHYQQRVYQREQIAYLLQQTDPMHQTTLQQLMQRAHVHDMQQQYIMAQAYLSQQQSKQAAPFVQQLIDNERQHPQQFADYRFDPAVLLSMQHAIYGDAVTASARVVVPKAQQAYHVSQTIKVALGLMLALGIIVVLILWRLHAGLGQRIHRIKTIYDQDWQAKT